MMKRKPATGYNVLLSAAMAIVWTINCIIFAGYTGQNQPPEIMVMLDIVGAVICWVNFAVVLIRYRKSGLNK